MLPTCSNTHLSASLAARPILSIHSRNINDTIPFALSKPNSRIRVERRYGEVIISGTLLQDLRKDDANVNKVSKQKSVR